MHICTICLPDAILCPLFQKTLFALLLAETAFSFEFDWQQSAEVCYEHCYVLCSVQFEKSVQSCIGQCGLCSMQCALWKTYALCIGQAGSLGGLNWRPWIFLCHCLKLPALNTAHTAHCCSPHNTHCTLHSAHCTHTVWSYLLQS